MTAIAPIAPDVTLTARAAQRIARIVAEQGAAALRVSVSGGGCSGFRYDFAFERSRGTDDLAVERDGATVLIDPVSLAYLGGAEIDFVDELLGQSFQVKNPNATASCGCGTSFTV
ncbi:MAG: iron-sulfur cluster insertion protein ErpA [Bauldia sp.]